MAVQVEAGGDFAKALSDIINPKLVEVGWSQGQDDDTVSEYIILMLANGKNQQELAAELSNDLLNLEPGDNSAIEFASWLFQQIESLNNQSISASSIPQDSTDDPSEMQMDGATALDDQTQESDRPIPTGPKAMRGGKANGNRMFNQINRTLDRGNDSALHRIQGAGGVGRINSHNGRGNMRGSKGTQIQRNFDGVNRRTMKNAAGPTGNMNFPMQGVQGQQGPMNQTQLLQMLEQQAAIMTQLASSHGLLNPAFAQQNSPFQQPNQNGRSLGERIGRGGNRRPQRRNGDNASSQADTTMADDGDSTAITTDANEGSTEPSMTICKFNLYCTKADCPFAHQSPAAPPGMTLDLNTECTFGAACKNHKCASKHPSPAKKYEHQQSQECKFGPFCQNPRCTFKHSTAKPCRNGGDCTTPGCTYFHSPIECKFNPCTNAHCIYKHKEGQRGSQAAGHVWKANGGHVSDRKFVDNENGEEEVIIPGKEMEVATAIATEAAQTA